MTRRYPLEPLVAALGLPAGASVTRALNVSGSRLHDLVAYGLEERTAERLAVRAGLVPYEVWPEMLDHAIADMEVECAAPDCTERFVPKWRGAHRRYHSSNCRDRTNARRRYQERADVRAAKRAAVAQYAAEVERLRNERSVA